MSFFVSTAILFLFLLLHSSAAQTNVNTAGNPMIIGVPSISFSSRFVQKDSGDIYTGFSIQVFEEVQKLLDYKINYKFMEFDGTYDDLVASVGNKTLDAAVGDITIISERWDLVDFTIPYTKSDLSMVVPVKHAEPWVFFKPSTFDIWLATGSVLLCTILVRFVLEHRTNSDFVGSWKHQLINSLWLTFTSQSKYTITWSYKLWDIGIAHRQLVAEGEMFKSNYFRMVVMFLLVALTMTRNSCYTVKRLTPNIDLLRIKDSKVGCNPLMKRFVQNELGYRSENIELMYCEKDYIDAFEKGIISAAWLEILYAKLLVNRHPKEYTITGSSYRFGGLSFAFQKGSQLANDVSEAILKLSENGRITRLEERWITSFPECSVDSNGDQTTIF